MASGCIIDECILCNEFIWEDELYSELEDGIVHCHCKKDYRNNKFIYKQEFINFIKGRLSEIHSNYFHFQEAEKELNAILSMLENRE